MPVTEAQVKPLLDQARTLVKELETLLALAKTAAQEAVTEGQPPPRYSRLL